MRKFKIHLFTGLVSLFALTNILAQTVQKNTGSAETIFFETEKKVAQKLNDCFQKANAQPLLSLAEQFEHTNKNMSDYWQAYMLFYASIYRLKTGDQKKAETLNDQAMSLLIDKKGKNSEEWALLSYLKSYSIQFKGQMKAGAISSRSTSYAEKALELEADNPRALYVLGSNDFYTPEMFGGGKKAEQYLKKCIEIITSSTSNPYMPQWGADDAYAMLLQLYQRQDKDKLVRETLDEALSDYPDSYRLNQWKEKYPADK